MNERGSVAMQETTISAPSVIFAYAFTWPPPIYTAEAATFARLTTQQHLCYATERFSTVTMATAGLIGPFARAPSCSYQPLRSGKLPLRTPIGAPNARKGHSFSLIHLNSTLQLLNHRFKPSCALDSDAPYAENKGLEERKVSKELEQWDSVTAAFAGASNVPFLLLQLPQIVLNARNLMAGNKMALFAVPWLGIFTGLLGNLSLLSYFVKKREKEAILVQTLGVISMYAVISQLAMAEAMPLPYFVATSVVVACGLVLNFMNYLNLLNAGIWRFWEDFITVGGLSALPQVMWSTFIPYVPNSILPGLAAFIIAVGAVAMARTGKLSERGIKFVGSISGWTATLLFMWMPVAQMWTSFLNPENIKGLSAFSMLLAMIGNGLMIPRALFIRDFMWFTGATWASVLYGWGNLICMYWFNSINREFFFSATLALFTWLGVTFWRDTKVYGYNSPFRSLKDLVFGA